MKMYIPALCLCFLLSGCAKKQIIDKVKIIQSIGYDIQGDTYKSSASYSSYDKKARLQVLTSEAQTFSGVHIGLNTQSDDQIVIGQLRTIVISEKFARRGLQDLVSGIIRDPIVSSNATVVITKQETSAILSETLKYPPFYLSDLIKQNVEYGNIPLTNTHLLLDQYFGAGQDMYLPMLNKDEKGVFHLDGVGVFKGDKLHLLLTNKEAFFLKILKDKSRNISSFYEFTTEQKEKIYLKILHEKRKVSLQQNDKAVIYLKLNIDLRDIPNKSSVDKSQLLELKKQIENHFSKEITTMLEKFQNNNIDPIGFGELYRGKEKNWNQQEFSHTSYPKIKFEVYPEIIILQSGVGISATKS